MRMVPILTGLCCILLFLLAFSQPTSPPRQALVKNGLADTLHHSWIFYKQRFLVDGQRVESNHYGGTITEGQSYALLKSVWMNDPTTFESVWRWTRQHMQRPADHLFGWRWGEREDGTWGLLETENATDADQDIAYALLLAGEKWRRPDYTEAALPIIRDFWRLNVKQVYQGYYLAPGTWKGFHQPMLTLNPSYFAPYVYRTFAKHDPAHAKGWLALAQHIYPTLEACSRLTDTKLPPNWCGVQYEDGQIVFSEVQGPNARDFSYDAFRVFWRMAMDAASGSPQAKAYLEKHRYLQTYWQQHHTLPEGFSAHAQPLGNAPSGFTLSAALAQRHYLAPTQDAGHYQVLLAPYYHPEGYWFNDYNDYLHSVIWLHLYTLSLPSMNL